MNHTGAGDGVNHGGGDGDGMGGSSTGFSPSQPDWYADRLDGAGIGGWSDSEGGGCGAAGLFNPCPDSLPAVVIYTRIFAERKASQC